ncbi:YbaK/EbsC family protein [Candidatus Bathyarchaeota archaeon]|nr:YbaK/EbsC family protein [Candidatus Bathyarchaeota archaeon]MBS7628637.1 YbaK/EbsC family protein [Candidatus Bathyarchaeota archaeon]
MNLDEYLIRNNVWHRFIQKAETIHTSDAAKATGVELRRVTKNLVSVTDGGEHVLLIVPGDRKVDLEKAAKILGVKHLRLVAFDQAEKISGYPPGGTPSVGHKEKMRVLLDKILLDYNTVYCGGGSRDRLLELKVQDIIRLNDATVGEVCR